MHRLLLLVLALIVLGIEILMGSRAFFPELFENRSSGVEDILADKENILKQLSPEDLAYVSKIPSSPWAWIPISIRSKCLTNVDATLALAATTSKFSPK